MVQNSQVDTLSHRSDPKFEEWSTPQISMFKLGQLAQIPKSEQLLVQLLSLKGKVSTRCSALATGYDLYSAEDAFVAPHSLAVVSTDIAILVLPVTYRCIVSRLGFAVKFSIDILAGVIDLDHRSNVRILNINQSN